MQWHWGNIGSMLAGLSTIIIAVAALIRSPGVLRDWRARQGAEADRAQAEGVALDRRRTLLGWSPHGVETYTVALVTGTEEMKRAVAELAGGGPTSYVILR